jgi:shikimate kinase
MSAPINHPDATTAQVGAATGAPARRGLSNVVLIGLSGSGKTTVGRLLAKRLGWRFVDTDREIQHEQGQSVQAIFREHGEPSFRAIEAAMVARVCGRTHQVIATGGGSPVAEANRERMLDGNLVIFLECAPSTLANRLTRSIAREPRPMLEDRDLAERLAELGEQRDAAYRCAHHVVQTDHRTPREVADVIADLVRARL